MENIISVRAELRAESTGEKFQLTGYAALFNSPSKNLGGFVETIAPGAFDRALREKQVVRFTFNHSMDAVLARSDNSTLALSTDRKGLRFTAQLNKNIQQHKDIFEACKAGLYNECSFAFTVAPDGQQWSPDGTQRTLLDVDLLDCSLVGSPAYEGTSAAARSAAPANVDAIRARVLAMPGDWARAERAHAVGLEIIASRGSNATDSDDDDVDGDEGLEDLRDALHAHFGKADHGLTPRYWPVERNDSSVTCCDMNAHELSCCSIPYTCDDDGNFTFGDPAETDYSPTGRASQNAHEARTARADGALRMRMQVAAGIWTGTGCR
jgi:hypothetical protein